MAMFVLFFLPCDAPGGQVNFKKSYVYVGSKCMRAFFDTRAAPTRVGDTRYPLAMLSPDNARRRPTLTIDSALLDIKLSRNTLANGWGLSKFSRHFSEKNGDGHTFEIFPLLSTFIDTQPGVEK